MSPEHTLKNATHYRHRFIGPIDFIDPIDEYRPLNEALKLLKGFDDGCQSGQLLRSEVLGIKQQLP